MNNEEKKEDTEINQRTVVESILEKVPVDELLGSVTTYPEGNEKSQSLRSSARVFKKIKLDANLNAVAISNLEKTGAEKKDEPKLEQPPPKEIKKSKLTWSKEDRTLFFEALNEHGKDFESIHNHIILKLKRKGIDNSPITKDDVRSLYVTTWHKISKHLHFNEGTKKLVQELYGLINYGEMRKKIGMVTLKTKRKLNELILNGFVALKVKGKIVRIKTPPCAALRRLNKLNDKDVDFKLPLQVTVELRPRDMATFLRVQNVAANPRIRAVLPLQKKLSALVACVSKKWRAAEIEYLQKIYPKENEETATNMDLTNLHFAPPIDVKMNVPKANISDFSTKETMCLKAFEERNGIRSKFLAFLAEKKDARKTSQKQKSECSNETASKSPTKTDFPDEKLNKLDTPQSTVDSQSPFKTPDDSQKGPLDKEINETLNNFLAFLERAKEKSSNKGTTATADSNENSNQNNKSISIQERMSKLERIRNGWTVEDCDNLTVGELYLTFGAASKLAIEYYWPEEESKFGNLKENFGYTNALNKLVSLVQLQNRSLLPTKCSCGHSCFPKNGAVKKSHKSSESDDKGTDDISKDQEEHDEHKKPVPFDDFLRPQSTAPVHLIAQLDSIEKLKPKYSVRKGIKSKQLVVGRELPLTPDGNNAHHLVRMNIISESRDELEEDNSECESHPQIFENKNFIEQTKNVDNVVPCSSSVTDLSTILQDTRSLSPTRILKENDNHWISSEVADFSLSSFLGHLEGQMKVPDELSHDFQVDSHVRSLLIENSFDYTDKFVDLANRVTSDTTN